MHFRNIVLALGALLVFAGIGLSLFWLSQMAGTPGEVKQEPQRPVEVRPEAVLEAVHPLPAGTLIRPADFRWREIDPSEVRPGTILRKEASEAEYLGAIVSKRLRRGRAAHRRRSRQDHRQALSFGSAETRHARCHYCGRCAARLGRA